MFINIREFNNDISHHQTIYKINSIFKSKSYSIIKTNAKKFIKTLNQQIINSTVNELVQHLINASLPKTLNLAKRSGSEIIDIHAKIHAAKEEEFKKLQKNIKKSKQKSSKTSNTPDEIKSKVNSILNNIILVDKNGKKLSNDKKSKDVVDSVSSTSKTSKTPEEIAAIRAQIQKNIQDAKNSQAVSDAKTSKTPEEIAAIRAQIQKNIQDAKNSQAVSDAKKNWKTKLSLLLQQKDAEISNIQEKEFDNPIIIKLISDYNEIIHEWKSLLNSNPSTKEYLSSVNSHDDDDIMDIFYSDLDDEKIVITPELTDLLKDELELHAKYELIRNEMYAKEKLNYKHYTEKLLDINDEILEMTKLVRPDEHSPRVFQFSKHINPIFIKNNAEEVHSMNEFHKLDLDFMDMQLQYAYNLIEEDNSQLDNLKLQIESLESFLKKLPISHSARNQIEIYLNEMINERLYKLAMTRSYTRIYKVMDNLCTLKKASGGLIRPENIENAYQGKIELLRVFTRIEDNHAISLLTEEEMSQRFKSRPDHEFQRLAENLKQLQPYSLIPKHQTAISPIVSRPFGKIRLAKRNNAIYWDTSKWTEFFDIVMIPTIATLRKDGQEIIQRDFLKLKNSNSLF